ncbi:multiubiquitin domain-containing protein [Antrihabitans sp. YC3-6]|uniref:Multiubiquitin domain-containing protein n=1 Tax=Antrihabitans stalagmiti TaxID=2799499 RepID=A0A934NWR9_9NOCA|nr:multiubiquitin domain-containing protein [Antrihabitans stalagmiti]MBJ8342973.1 multiubiquitin domain-containing protein [Antrihabitans stalagmiti]
MTASEIGTTLGHEHHDRAITIVVNTRPCEWTERTISYEEVVELAYPGQPIGEADEVTVRFTRGHAEKREGSLTPGRSVKVKDKMVFDVYRTSRS